MARDVWFLLAAGLIVLAVVIAVVLLSAPAEVLLERISARETNDYGKTREEQELIVMHLREVEPLLRATCTHEIDATEPLNVVVERLVEIGRGR